MEKVILLVIILGLFSCNLDTTQSNNKKEKVDEKNEEVGIVSISKDNDADEVKSKYDFVLPALPQEINDFSIEKISEIHQYLSIERWNNNGDIGLRNGTDYQSAAKILNIPVSKLKAADSYYHYSLLKSMTKWIKVFLDTIPQVKPSYYNAVQAAAYTGFATLYGEIEIEGNNQEKEIDVKKVAANIAIRLANELPDWITGYKFYWTTYKDTYLETVEDVDIAFLWVRGNESIYEMKPERTTYTGRNPLENDEWASSRWNNMKKIEHPNYRFISIKTN